MLLEKTKVIPLELFFISKTLRSSRQLFFLFFFFYLFFLKGVKEFEQYHVNNSLPMHVAPFMGVFMSLISIASNILKFI